MGHIVPFLLRPTLKLHTKCATFEVTKCPLSMGNGMICCKERHPLLLKGFISFLWCIRKTGGAFDNIHKPIIVHIVPFPLRLTLKFHTKWQILGTPSARELGCCCCRERYPLLLKYGILLPRCMKRWEDFLKASTSPFCVKLCYLCQNWFPIIAPYKMLHWGYPIRAGTVGCCATRIDIHCCWSIWCPSSCPYARWEELLIAAALLLL